VGNQLHKTSVSTNWDDLGRFRPLDVPLLFLDFAPDSELAEPAEPRLATRNLGRGSERNKKGTLCGCRVGSTHAAAPPPIPRSARGGTKSASSASGPIGKLRFRIRGRMRSSRPGKRAEPALPPPETMHLSPAQTETRNSFARSPISFAGPGSTMKASAALAPTFGRNSVCAARRDPGVCRRCCPKAA
jgi:hypothetical protein